MKADLRAEQRAEDADIGDLLKQSEKDKELAKGPKKPNANEGQGGVNARGNGGPPAGCPPAGGKPGNSGREFNKNLRGANGAQTASTTLMPRRSISKDYSFRMDVENPKPGYAEGNIHVQLGGKGSEKYYWRGGTSFTTDKLEQLPKVARNYIDNNKEAVERAVNQGLKVLGEK
ncbi:hypothetical protein GCM10028864_54680 [Microlunatus parietis]|uniref:hypothetical protein n=1 Tax=Microlunatus parietis TaxID=682979 RepID=UPI0015CDCF07|nr:hypothetical protein [Microlunatus parietis]